MNLIKYFVWIFAALMLVSTTATAGEPPLTLDLKEDPTNTSAPTLGDKLRYWSTITNTGDQPIEGLVAWISLVEIDQGNEQPVDLEDWSAHKAITGVLLGPGQSLKTDWPMRLIKGGNYRVVISVTDRNSRTVHTSPILEFHVKQKPVLQVGRVLFVAGGVPLFIIVLIVLTEFKKRRGCKKNLPVFQ
ncbi:MAG: hypothetical protein M0Z56_03460 [Desulfobacteraceae bacterium]|nr:hypothetical protein [Desulfobacteraceae bacterium]